jgi:hypothetical protein
MVAVRIRRARLHSTIRVASSSALELLRRKRLQRSSSLPFRQSRQLLAKQLQGGDDHGTQLCERFGTDVDGATARDQQQPQRLAPLASARERERVAGERGPRGPGRVHRVASLPQPPLAARFDLEHAVDELRQAWAYHCEKGDRLRF